MPRRVSRGCPGAGVALLSAATLALPAAAQDTRRFELGIFAGADIGTRISLTPQAEDRIGDAPAFGLRGA